MSLDYDEETSEEYRTKEAKEWFNKDNRNQQEVLFDEIIADINEKLETAKFYYKKTAKILKEIL